MKAIANKEKTLDRALTEKIWKILFVAEVALLRSPYNFEIKIRMIQLYAFFGCIDKISDILKTMDIKSVQFETIGFFVAKLLLEYFSSEPRKDMLKGALQFYNENQKECKDLLMISINKNSNYEKFFEFLDYDEWIDNSYFKSIVYLLQAEELNKSSKKDSESKESLRYFLNYLLHKTGPGGPQATWNLDAKLMVPTNINNDSQKNPYFWNYLGIFNSPKVLRMRVLNLETELLMREFLSTEQLDSERMEKIIDEVSSLLAKINVDELSDFSCFKVRNKPLNLLKIEKKNQYDLEEVTRILLTEHLNCDIANTLARLVHTVVKLDFNKHEETVKNIDKLGDCFKKLSSHLQPPKIELTSIFPITWAKCLIRTMNRLVPVLEVYLLSYDFLKTTLNRGTKKADEETKKKANSLGKSLLSFNKEALETFLEVMDTSQKYISNLRSEVKETVEKPVNIYLKESSIIEKLKSNEFLKVTQTAEDFVNNIVTEYSCLALNIIDEIKEKTKILKPLLK